MGPFPMNSKLYDEIHHITLIHYSPGIYLKLHIDQTTGPEPTSI